MVLGHELVGSGNEGVIVFNDWLADCTSWKPMHLYLDKKAFTYAFTDIRGYGRSINIKGEHTAKEAAADAFALADSLGWQRFHIVGFSMTGMVVERMVLMGPDRIKSEIAIGPVPPSKWIPSAAPSLNGRSSTMTQCASWRRGSPTTN